MSHHLFELPQAEKPETGRGGEWTTVFEATQAELREGSGIFDETTGRELTNYAAVRLIEQHLGAQALVMTMGSTLSVEGQQRNSLISHLRLDPQEYVYAVRSLRPIPND